MGIELPGDFFLLTVINAVIIDHAFFFTHKPESISRHVHGINPYSEALEVAEYIKLHSAPEDRIAVLGSEPEIYFYSDRLSASGYIYMYALMEPQPYAKYMQQEMIKEIESSNPIFVVDVHVRKSWLKSSTSEDEIFTWREQYLRDYEKVGTWYIQPDGKTFSLLGDDRNKEHLQNSGEQVHLYRKTTKGSSCDDNRLRKTPISGTSNPQAARSNRAGCAI